MPTFRTLGLLLALVALMAVTGSSARAANTMQFFFPVDNELFSTFDDEIVVKSIFWDEQNRPVQWVLMSTLNNTVILPISNPLGMSSDDVEFAVERALKEWNRNELSSFKYEDDIFKSTSPLVDAPGPSDVGFDGYNVMSFMTSAVTPESGAGFGVSIFFMERDLDIEDAFLVPVDTIELTDDTIVIDLDADEFVDLELPLRDYKQAEIIEADIAFNPALQFVDWPADFDDVPDALKPMVPNSSDVQAIATQALGFAQGLAISLLFESTLNTVLIADTGVVRIDPFNVRKLSYDDKLAGALLYPANNLSSKGSIRGNVIDGQFVERLESENPPPINSLTINEQFVVMAPVFLGVPAPVGYHVDNAWGTDREGNPITLRLIAQVLSGRSLRYPAGQGGDQTGGAAELEPATTEDPNIDFGDTGEWIFDAEFEVYLPGLDLNNNGIYDLPTTDIDGQFLFLGLEARDDYAIYLDKDRYDGNETFTNVIYPDGYPDVHNVHTFLSEQETYPPEFYGGADEDASFADTQFDEREVIDFISVQNGQVTDNIIIITNIDADDDDPDCGCEPPPGTGPDNGAAITGLVFAPDPLAINPTDYVPSGADIGDLNGDGYLDFVVATFGGGFDPNIGRVNRIFINEAREFPTPGRFFRDVTFGFDSVPGTSDDVLPAHTDVSRDIKLADFNGDGRLDIFVSNAVTPNDFTSGKNRLYLNEAIGTNPWGVRFRDVSSQVLPGVLNHPYADYPDDSSKVAVGDIDNDGDIDIIISLFTPLHDAQYTFVNGLPSGAGLPPTTAIIDADPPAPNSSGDHSYNPLQDPIVADSQLTEVTGGGPPVSVPWPYVSAGPAFGGPLFFSERVLINYQTGGNPGFAFRDDTLGADNRFGDSELIEFGPGSIGFQLRPNSDRMPPIFPPVMRFNAEGARTGGSNSPMGTRASEPLLGPLTRDGSLDLVSLRLFQDTYFYNGAGFNASQAAFFDNLDLTGDFVPDGYFACVNYDFDFFFRRGSGLYPIREITDDDGFTTVLLEALPLLIGIPDGVTGDITATGTSEGNTFTVVQRGAFAGSLEDFEYRGSPKPMIAADSSFNGPPFVYKPIGIDFGVGRGQTGIINGIGLYYNATRFFREFGGANDGSIDIPAADLPALTASAEAHGAVAADFDHDGDFDLLIASNVAVGRFANGSTVAGEPPVPNTFYTNDGYANFTNTSETVLPGLANAPAYSYVPLAGDIDNDGDIDSIIINGFGSHQVLLNQVYSPRIAADLVSTSDATLFYDQTQSMLAPFIGASLAPPFTFTGPSAKTTSVAAVDLNADNLPDLIAADGGIQSLEFDIAEIHLNGGPPRPIGGSPFNSGMKRFMPYGAPYPSPQINYLGFQSSFFGGLGDAPGGYFGISTGDFSGDGYADLFFSRNGGGPVAYLNVDLNDSSFISEPDFDSIPDGIMVNLNFATNVFGIVFLPPLSDPCGDPESQVVRKNLGRRLAAADYDGNGSLDVAIANGLDASGAPNVLLLNYPIFQPGPDGEVLVPFFLDVSETNVPTEIGVCGLPEGVSDNTYAIGAADFDHDGDIDMVYANQTNTIVNGTRFPGFRYLSNDGKGVFEDTTLTVGNLPSVYLDTKPRYVLVADFDGVGEWTEDLNRNGVLDFGEDFNGNGLLDRSEDRNGNGVLDPGEDLDEDINGDGILQSWEDRNFNGVLDFGGDGIMTWVDLPDETTAGDLNGDGIITKRTAGVWEPSFDMFVSMENREDLLLINDPTNTQPGIFSDESDLRLPGTPLTAFLNSRGARAGDIDLDGDLDIVVAKLTLNTFMRPVQVLRNNGRGFFADISHEVPFPSSIRTAFESPNGPSTAGNAQDVELVDVDNDGDLDMYVGMSGPEGSLVTVGGDNVVYVNRRIGGNWNEGYRRLVAAGDAAALSSQNPPVVFFASPANGLPGQNMTVDLAGANFTPDTMVNFGAGITVNSVSVIGSSVLRATISVDPVAEIGPRSVLATDNGSGQSTKTEPGVFNIKGLSSNDADPEEWLKYQ